MAGEAGSFRERLFSTLAARGIDGNKVEQAAARARGQPLPRILASVGLTEVDVVDVLSRATGWPIAPKHALGRPVSLPGGWDSRRLLERGIAAFPTDDGRLGLAFTDPSAARAPDVAQMPAHVKHLLGESQLSLLQQAIATQLGQGGEGGEDRTQMRKVAAEQAAPAATPESFLRSGKLGPYKVEKELGRGGMATVLLAREMGTDRPVAVKAMLPALATDEEFVSRFLLEAKATAGMRHPNIVEVLLVGQDGQSPYIAYEFMDGGTVENMLEKTGKLPAPVAAEVICQTLAGVGHAHQKGVIHRDLKPANLLVTRAGQVKVGDFGIARMEGNQKMTQTGMVLGTPAYMSPEQARGKIVGPQSDLFTLGVIFYELLTGRNPHQAENAAAAMARILEPSTPPPAEVEPTVPEEIEAIIERMLTRDLNVRPPNCELVQAELEAYLAPYRSQGRQLIAEALADPVGSVRRVSHEEAGTWYGEALQLATQGPAERKQAALALYRATLLAPDDAEITNAFHELAQAEGLRFGAPTNPKIGDLERVLASGPEAPGVLQQLAQLYKLEGNLWQSAQYLKRYLKLRPNDGVAQGQLSQILGKRTAARTGAGGHSGPAAARNSGPSPAAGATASTRSFPGAAPTGFQPGLQGGHTGGRMQAAPPGGGNTQALIDGVRTGGIAAARGGNTNPFSAAPGTSQVAAADPGFREYAAGEEPPSQLAMLWQAWGKTAVGLLVVGLIGWGIVRKLSKVIDDGVKVSTEGAEKMAAGAAQQEMARLEKNSNLELAKAKVEAGFEAARLIADADAAFRQARYAAAAQLYESIETTYPKRPEAQSAAFGRGRALLLAGKRADALTVLSDFKERFPGSPDYPEAILRAGEASAGLGVPLQAIASYSEFLQRFPTHGLHNEAQVLRGEAHAAAGHTADATADFQTVLSHVGPGDVFHARATRGMAALAAPAATTGTTPGAAPTP